MTGRSTPFWRWPGWGHLGYTARLELAAAIWLELVYGGADALTARRTFRVPVHFPAELNVPFVPGMVVVYVSIHLLFAAVPFVLRTRSEVRALIITLVAVITIAGVSFVLLPAELAFPPPGDLGRWQALFRLADWLNLDYNLVPSLHVALSVACLAAFASRAGLAGAVVLWTWAVAIAASTLLTHQHHLVDVATGVALAFGANRLIYRRLAGTSENPTNPPDLCGRASPTRP